MSARHSNTALATYAAPAAALAALAMPLQVYVPTLYAQEIGLSLTTVGVILLIARLWDMVVDPIVGMLSDRVRTRFGRRRTWMAIGTPFLMLFSWLLYFPPEGAGALWLLLGLIGVYTFGTLLIVPMNAWGAELTQNISERTRIVAFRSCAGLVGALAALTVPAALGYGTDEVGASTRVVGIIGIMALPFLVWLALKGTPDQAYQPLAHARRVKSTQEILSLLRIPSIPWLYGAFLLNNIATAFPAGLFLLFAKHQLERPDLAGLWLVSFFGATILSLPFWTWISKRIGKAVSWVWGMSAAAALFLWSPFLGPDHVIAYTFIVLATGICAGANLALPASILGDIVGADGEGRSASRAGLAFSVWGAIAKFSMAVAAGLSFLWLGWVGFDTAAEVGAQSTFALASAYGWAAVACNLMATGIVLRWGVRPAGDNRMPSLAT